MVLLDVDVRASNFSDEQLRQRFRDYLNRHTALYNHMGYGYLRPFVPPLQTPQTIAAIKERSNLLLDRDGSTLYTRLFYQIAMPILILSLGTWPTSRI